ncbi:MAG: hypothetical protein KKA19_09885 [Candidatus Margulisbacteria bacterium]|nr:hypothetical protein [Candidatus Margulisiibacteriota bacterium]
MPYIGNQDRRKEMDAIFNLMEELGVKADGDLNYLLFKYCKYCIKPGYNNYKNFLGELRQCCVEIERRLLAPYEDLKIKENKDV